MGKSGLILSALLLGVLPRPAMAENSSVYTRLVLADCRSEALSGEVEDGGVWWCEGHAGIMVRVAEGDLRMMVSYGPEAASEPAAGWTLPAFNTIGETLEWRLDEQGRPIATILRFRTADDAGKRRSTLVVTRLGPPGTVCPIGTVDAVDNPDANEIARAVADNFAGNACPTGEVPDYGINGEPVERY
jgi:hypothetical protein